MEGKNFNNRWAAFKVLVDGHVRTALACAETVDVDLVEQAIGLDGVMVEMTKAGNWHSLQFCRASEWMDITRFEAGQRLKGEAPAPEPPITKDQPSFDDTMHQYYQERTGGNKDTNWSEQLKPLFTSKLRPHMKDFLNKRGFGVK